MPFLAKWIAESLGVSRSVDEQVLVATALTAMGRPTRVGHMPSDARAVSAAICSVSDSHFYGRPSWARRETISAGVLDDVRERTNMDFAQCLAVVDMLLTEPVTELLPPVTEPDRDRYSELACETGVAGQQDDAPAAWEIASE